MSGGGKGFKISSMKMFGRLFEKKEEEEKKRWGDVIEGVTIKFNPGVNERKAILGGIKVHGVPSTFFRAVD